MRRYEYARFHARFPLDIKITDLDPASIILAKWDLLGADGWEIFELTFPSTINKRDTAVQVSLWARRLIEEGTE